MEWARGSSFPRPVGRSLLFAGAVGLPVQVTVQLVSRVMQVLLVHDVIAVKNTAGLVAGNSHGHFFRDASAHQIPDASAPKVMEQARDSRFLGRLVPRLADVHHLMTTPC